MPPRHRRFGTVRKLPSGRFQASYLGPDGRRRTAETPFDTKTDADRWLNVVRASMIEDRWRDPNLGRETVDQFVTRWIAERPGLRPRTRDLYEWLHRKYIEPTLGKRQVRQLNPGAVRTWRAGLLDDGVSSTMTAKAYRLLRASMNTAVDDGLLGDNPCRLPKAGLEHADERPTLTVSQVFALADVVPKRYRALVLVATFGSLRWGEAAALRRRDLDLDRGLLTVRNTVVELAGQPPQLGPPKSKAGVRVVGLPSQVVGQLAEHLANFVEDGPDAMIFTGRRGNILRRGNFNPLTKWTDAVASIGAPGLHFHDLRHTGNVLAAAVPGTSTRDLMQRMGHDSMRAALIYQHLAADADKRLTDGLTTQLNAHFDNAADSLDARSMHDGRSE